MPKRLTAWLAEAEEGKSSTSRGVEESTQLTKLGLAVVQEMPLLKSTTCRLEMSWLSPESVVSQVIKVSVTPSAGMMQGKVPTKTKFSLAIWLWPTAWMQSSAPPRLLLNAGNLTVLGLPEMQLMTGPASCATTSGDTIKRSRMNSFIIFQIMQLIQQISTQDDKMGRQLQRSFLQARSPPCLAWYQTNNPKEYGYIILCLTILSAIFIYSRIQEYEFIFIVFRECRSQEQPILRECLEIRVCKRALIFRGGQIDMKLRDIAEGFAVIQQSIEIAPQGQFSSLWPYPPAANPKSLYLPAVHLSLRSTAQRCTSRKWRVTQVAVWISRAWKSVLPSMLYLKPRAQISCCRPKQSIVSYGIVVTKSLISVMSLTRSVTDALAAFASTSVTKTTILWEVGVSKQYLIMYGPSSLFSANKPSKTCWMISLSVIARDYQGAVSGWVVR